jgi:hypothetical protein
VQTLELGRQQAPGSFETDWTSKVEGKIGNYSVGSRREYIAERTAAVEIEIGIAAAGNFDVEGNY